MGIAILEMLECHPADVVSDPAKLANEVRSKNLIKRMPHNIHLRYDEAPRRGGKGFGHVLWRCTCNESPFPPRGNEEFYRSRRTSPRIRPEGPRQPRQKLQHQHDLQTNQDAWRLSKEPKTSLFVAPPLQGNLKFYFNATHLVGGQENPQAEKTTPVNSLFPSDQAFWRIVPRRKTLAPFPLASAHRKSTDKRTFGRFCRRATTAHDQYSDEMS
ncbi:hypothetical protein HPB51_020863 [Rhipicephalus microplus]|uniref:Uncharacterized protein n=1 Tax=Rhipicephalus microplus TaxID=6941 RepID=A0A9J6ECK0_RHIMP|nr:hypothetical protein HPB51_020863 [Rhipicephalus microplus]